jgi:hypothetical protein
MTEYNENKQPDTRAERQRQLENQPFFWRRGSDE